MRLSARNEWQHGVCPTFFKDVPAEIFVMKPVHDQEKPTPALIVEPGDDLLIESRIDFLDFRNVGGVANIKRIVDDNEVPAAARKMAHDRCREEFATGGRCEIGFFILTSRQLRARKGLAKPPRSREIVSFARDLLG